MKVCSRCGEPRAVADFPKDKRKRDGLGSPCRTCRKDYVTNGSNRRSWLKKIYGITPEQHAAMVAAQGGRCAVCGHPPARNKHGTHVLAIDHNHETGRVRGLLCHRCNAALGMMREDLDLITKLWQYLDRWNDIERGEGHEPFSERVRR